MVRFLFFILLLSCFSCNEAFVLKQPDSKALTALARQGEFYGDVVHLYLTENYDSTSGKKDIKYLDYDPEYECGFTQEFEGGIVFRKESCLEAGGVNWALDIPNVNETEIKQWVERLYAAELPDWPGEWTSEWEYGTQGGEAGCYYSLVQKADHWQVVIWCGS